MQHKIIFNRSFSYEKTENAKFILEFIISDLFCKFISTCIVCSAVAAIFILTINMSSVSFRNPHPWKMIYISNRCCQFS